MQERLCIHLLASSARASLAEDAQTRRRDDDGCSDPIAEVVPYILTSVLC